MGRPRGAKNKATLAKLGLDKAGKPVKDTRTDLDIVSTIVERFNVYYRMVKAAAQEAITALIVSGSAGVGKTYTAQWALNHEKETKGTRFKLVNGNASAIGLYETAYRYRHSKDVIVLDDADRIFDDEESLNILKVLLDTSHERWVSWITDHAMFKGEGDDKLPREFVYNGSMIFLTNKDFQSYIDTGKGRYVEHMEALMSRSIYLDLKMHNRREVALWMKHIVLKNKILQAAPIYLSADQEQEAVNWILKNRAEVRELSIRTALKLGKMMKMDRDDKTEQWERMAEITLLRNE
jgi:hypothetical protein